MRDLVRVAGVQMKLISESRKARDQNLTRALELMKEAVQREADIVCLPELFLGAATVETMPASTIDVMCGFARDHKVWVIPNLYVTEDDKKYSLSPLIGPDGSILGVYRKAHLFPWEHKFTRLTAGDALPVFETELGRMSILICQDAMVPEAVRVVSLKGAEVVFVQSRMPGPFLVPWRDVMRTRAIENQVYVVSVGGAGYHACGTLIVAPRLVNDIVVEAGKEEQVVTATLNLRWLREKRKRENQPLYFVKEVADLHEALDTVDSYTFPLDRNPKLYDTLLTPHDPTAF